MAEQRCRQCGAKYTSPDIGPNDFQPDPRRRLCDTCEEELGCLMVEATPAPGRSYDVFTED